MGKFHNKNQSRYHGFMLAFTTSLAVMLLPLGLLFLFYNGATPQPEPAAGKVEAVEPLNILAAVNEAGEAPHTFALIRLDSSAKTVTLAMIPAEMPAEEGGRLAPIGDIWRKAGGERGTKAVAAALSIPIERWLALSGEDFAALIDLVGAVDFTLTAPIKGEDGMELLPEGRQLLDGRRLKLLLQLKYEGEEELDRLTLIGELCCALVRQQMGEISGEVSRKIFNQAANSGKNNLIATDIEARLNRDEEGKDVSARLLQLNGSYTQGGKTFILASKSATEIVENFR